MDPENEEQNNTEEISTEIDPWQAAFDAVNAATEKSAEENAEQGNIDSGNTSGGDGNLDASKPADESKGTNENGTGLDASLQGESGGSDTPGGEVGGTAVVSDTDDFNVTEEDIKQINDSIIEKAKDDAIRDVAQAFIKKGVRNRNGKLGATIDDPDICKRDEDGVPTFYNPDTGRPFTGDNPRRQAKEWVDDYNSELAQAFNQACQTYVNKVVEVEKPRMELLQFAPQYDKLDPIRRDMLDSILEDYEVKDADGDVIGYSCDLNKALAAVNRQVAMVQKHAAKTSAQQPASNNEPPQKKGPALDIKATGGGDHKDKPEFKSIEEAMEWQQDQLLLKNKK